MISEKILTPAELKTFEAELEKYRIRKTLSSGKEVTYIDFDEFLKKEKAITDKGAIIIPEDYVVREKVHITNFVQTPKYFLLKDKISQFQEWKSKREYAEKMKLKSYVEN